MAEKQLVQATYNIYNKRYNYMYDHNNKSCHNTEVGNGQLQYNKCAAFLHDISGGTGTDKLYIVWVWLKLYRAATQN